MYNYIQGKLVSKEGAYAVLDVGGVGYELLISLNTSAALRVGEIQKLFAYLHVKEDAHTLFGFSSKEEKWLFLKLISVSGIGPSTGLAMLSSLSVKELYTAITTDQVKIVQSIKGIGPKTAQRVILELKDRLLKDMPSLGLAEGALPAAGSTSTAQTQAATDTLEALLVMGIPKVSAEKMVAQIIKAHGTALTAEQMLKMALRSA